LIKLKRQMATIKEITQKVDMMNTISELEECDFIHDERKGVQTAIKRRRKALIKTRELAEQFEEMSVFERRYPGQLVAGIDEAGRGPLAGEVVAAAVILPDDFYLPGLNDSKQLSLKKRLEFRKVIMEKADYGIGIATVEEIDALNIYEASKCAMKRAVAKLNIRPDHLLVDAMTLDNGIEETSIIKGDARSVSIAAASVLAKTTRDAMMAEYDKQFPGYGFGQNKGYGTREHLLFLDENGVCPIHRQTFEPIKSQIAEK
jgi:ribonuclease HII